MPFLKKTDDGSSQHNKISVETVKQNYIWNVLSCSLRVCATFARRVYGSLWSFYEGDTGWIPWKSGEPYYTDSYALLCGDALAFGQKYYSIYHNTILCETSAAGMYTLP